MHIKSFISNEIEQAEQDYHEWYNHNKNSITVVSLSATPVIQNTQYKHLITVIYTPKTDIDRILEEYGKGSMKRHIDKTWPELL